MKKGKSVVLVGTLLALFTATTIAAQPAVKPLSVEERLARIERLLESQALVEMLSRIDGLQNELQTLRGEVERQTHGMEGIKQRQRDLYLDIDRRLSRLEREGTATSRDDNPAVQAPAAVVPALTAAPPARPVTSGPAKGAAAAEAAPPSPEDLAKEREAYQQAFELLRDLRYEQAIAAFQAFLKSYPEGRYGHIAQYWLGEANYARRDFPQAIVAYERLIAHYPQSPKLAEAMLKIGYSQYELGEKAKAQQVLNDLMQRYPGTTEAGQAQNLILKIRRELG